jgi:hypothetical protein
VLWALPVRPGVSSEILLLASERAKAAYRSPIDDRTGPGLRRHAIRSRGPAWGNEPPRRFTARNAAGALPRTGPLQALLLSRLATEQFVQDQVLGSLPRRIAAQHGCIAA